MKYLLALLLVGCASVLAADPVPVAPPSPAINYTLTPTEQTALLTFMQAYKTQRVLIDQMAVVIKKQQLKIEALDAATNCS